MRHFAITGIVTAFWMPSIIDGIAHAGDAAVAADVGRHPLERHHRGRAGVLGDLRLLGVDDVHDDAAPQHLREAPLDAGGTGGALVGHGPSLPAPLSALACDAAEASPPKADRLEREPDVSAGPATAR